MEKIFNQKSFHYFFWTPLGSRVSIWINFFLQKPAELVAKVAAGVVDTAVRIDPSRYYTHYDMHGFPTQRVQECFHRLWEQAFVGGGEGGGRVLQGLGGR
jgi:hypothetical protein